MSQTELQLRVTFATCALLTLGAVLTQIPLQGGNTNWPLVCALVAGFAVSAAEALGLYRLAQQPPWRLLGALLLGIAALYTLEC